MITINSVEEARLWQAISDDFTPEQKKNIYLFERKNIVTYTPLYDTDTRTNQKTARKSPKTQRVRQEGKNIPRVKRERSEGKRRAKEGI